MSGTSVGVATALALLSQGVPAAPSGGGPGPTSERVWASVFQSPQRMPLQPAGQEAKPKGPDTLGPGAADSEDGRRWQLAFECRMPVIQADPRVDPKMMLPSPPADAPKGHIRVIGELPECPRR